MKNYFSKNCFFEKKLIKFKNLNKKVQKLRKKGKTEKKQHKLHFLFKTLCKKTTFLKVKLILEKILFFKKKYIENFFLKKSKTEK